MVGGGLSKAFAKTVGQVIDPEGGHKLPNFVKIDPECFDYNCVTLLSDAKVDGTALKHASEIESHLEDTIGKKTEDCRKAADKNNWQGTLVKLDFEYPSDFSYVWLPGDCLRQRD